MATTLTPSPESAPPPATERPRAGSLLTPGVTRRRGHELPRIKTLPPLSALTYYRRNLTRTLPVGGAIIISVFLIAAIVTLLNSVDQTIATNYGFVRRFSVLTTQLEKEVPRAVRDKTLHVPGVGQTIPAVPYFMVLHTVFGEMPVPIYGVDEGAMPVVTQVTGNRLVEGRWPRPNEPELVLSRNWANNFGKKVGQTIVFKNDGFPTIADPQRIVGILDGGEHLALTERSYLELELPEPVVRTSYMLLPTTHSQLAPMNRAIDDVLKNFKQHGLTQKQVRYVKLYTFDQTVNEFRERFRFLYKFLAIADGLVIGAVALLSGFLANIYFEQRLGEFGLLSAFGFRREHLARRLVIEVGALVASAWVFGLAMTWWLFRLLDVYYMSPQGLILAKLDRLAFSYTLPTPILVGLASLGTVLFRLYTMDPIEIMERR